MLDNLQIHQLRMISQGQQALKSLQQQLAEVYYLGHEYDVLQLNAPPACV